MIVIFRNVLLEAEYIKATVRLFTMKAHLEQ